MSLEERAGSKCELCNSTESLSAYDVSGGPGGQVLVCGTCLGQIENPESIDANHWHCLNDSMWSEHATVQVMAYRMLKHLNDQSWALDLLDQLYLDDETKQWAEAGLENDDSVLTKDSNGTSLSEGDTVTLIKDLDVKGGGFTAKRGTVVKNIRLTDNPEHIEGKVEGQKIVLVAKFLKKA